MAIESETQSFAQATDLTGRAITTTNFLLDHWWLWLLFAVALWLILRLRRQHALLGLLDERCEASFADIDAILAERHALIPNLVETVKGFAKQEHKVLTDVIDARARALASHGETRLQAETQLGQSVNSLLALSENYPELASSIHFRELRSEMTRIEEKITASRRFYNLAVEEMNASRRAFPGNLVASFTTLGRHEKFTLGERREEFAAPVKVGF
jgi:LemA protein